ncbi:hypothetical protein ACVWZV_002191 [Bradyrhizobium sp. GM5.1]
MAKDPNEIGALWIKNGPKGQYMTGHVTVNGETVKLVCFTNNYKKEEKHPDWCVLISKPKDDMEERQGHERHSPAVTEEDVVF